MLRIEDSIIIQASLEKTYRIATTYPLFVNEFIDKEIISQSGHETHVRMKSIFWGIPLSWEGKGKTIDGSSIHWMQTKGLLSGLRANWVFDREDDNTTKVTIVGEMNLRSLREWILAPIAPFLVRRATARILQSLRGAAECTE